MRIGLLEDDASQVEVLQMWAGEADYNIVPFTTGESLKSALATDTFDMLMLDWNLPDTTGAEILTWVREKLDWHIPILFITSRDSEDDVVFALEQGADDYMIKPVNKNETLARIKALERRVNNKNSDILDYPPYQINLVERTVSYNDKIIELTNKEFELANLLFRNNGRLMSRGYIMERVWGTKADLNTRTVDTHMSRLRSKLEIKPQNGWQLSAVYHHGYRLTYVANNQ